MRGARPAIRTTVILGLLAAYLAASLGVVPSPALIARCLGLAAGERYPCEDCGCGCASALECWTRCCCHSEHERLIWALRHGVKPPDTVHFTDEQWIAAANSLRPGSAHCGLCVLRLQSGLARGEALVAGDAEANGDPAAATCCSTKSVPADDGWPGPRLSALSCKNLAQMLLIATPPAAPGLAGLVDLPRQIELRRPRVTVLRVLSRTLDAPVPPPRPRWG